MHKVPGEAQAQMATRSPRLSEPLHQLELEVLELVVGSGQGGDVVASPLARGGQEVCGPERAGWHVSDDPSHIKLEMMIELQVPSPLLGGRTLAHRLALQDHAMDDEMMALRGRGRGGALLIRAGLCLWPDPRVLTALSGSGNCGPT
jgi:choline dehydrogenase-like flavoprotein